MKQLDEDAVVKDVLVLGDVDEPLRRAILRRFPHATIVFQTVQGLNITQPVDLVVLNAKDKMYGAEDWERVCGLVSEHIERMGYILTPKNSRQPELPTVLFRQFSRQPKPRFRETGIVTYRPRGAGTPGDPLPSGYQVYHSSREALVQETVAAKRFTVIGKEGAWGSRWNYGPCWFEKYYGDQEPEVDENGPLRFVMWQTISRLDTPKGWRRTSLTNHFKKTGFETLDPTDAYAERWSSHARRYRAKWLKQKAKGDWEVFEPSADDFVEAYRRSKLDPVLKFLYINLVKEKAKTQPDIMRLFAVRRKPGMPMEAGFACIDLPESKQSRHFISFICESAKKEPVGVGLMDEWHRYAQNRGFRYLDFGIFWAKGDPREWRGFSKFKGQFDIWYIRYPRPLVRVVGSFWKIFKK